MTLIDQASPAAASPPAGQASCLAPAPGSASLGYAMRRLRLAVRAAEDLADAACHLPDTPDDELVGLHAEDERQRGWIAGRLGPDAERLVLAAQEGRWHVPDAGVCLPRGCRRCRRLRLGLAADVPLPLERNFAPDPDGGDLGIWLHAAGLGVLDAVGVLDAEQFQDAAGLDGELGIGEATGRW